MTGKPVLVQDLAELHAHGPQLAAGHESHRFSSMAGDGGDDRGRDLIGPLCSRPRHANPFTGTTVVEGDRLWHAPESLCPSS